LVRFTTGSSSRSKRISRSCGIGVDVELHPRLLVDLPLQPRQVVAKPQAEVGEEAVVDGDALPLHLRQHLDERDLDLAEEAVQLQLFQLRLELAAQPERDVGVLAGVAAGGGERHLGEGDLALPLAGHVGIGGGAVVEVLQRQRVEPMLAPAGVQQVAGDHRVEGDAPHRNPAAAQHQQVVLQVLPHLLHRGVLQHGDQRLHRRVVERGEVAHRLPLRLHPLHLPLLRSWMPVAERQIERLARLHGQGDADQLGPHRVQPARLGVEGHTPTLTDAGDEVVDLVRPLDEPALDLHPGRFRLLRHAVLAGQGGELEVQEDLLEDLAVRLANLEGIDIEIDGKVPVDGDEPLGEERLLAVLLQCLASPLPGDLPGPLQDLLHGAVLLDQLDRRLRPDPPHPRDVVGAVPDQPQVVRHPLRGHAEPLVRIGEVHPLLLHASRPAAPRVQEADAVADELVEVLVPRDDHRLQPARGRLLRQRADHIVRLVSLQLEHRDAEALQDPPNPGDGGLQLVRHLLAGRLVLRVDLHPLRVTRVEDHAQVVRLVLLQDLLEETGNSEGRRGVLAARGDERAGDHGEERPVDEGVAVDQEEARAGLLGDRHGRWGRGSGASDGWLPNLSGEEAGMRPGVENRCAFVGRQLR
jgi:hypothetical protein